MTSRAPGWRDNLSKHIPEALKEITSVQELVMKDGALSLNSK